MEYPIIEDIYRVIKQTHASGIITYMVLDKKGLMVSVGNTLKEALIHASKL